VAPIASCPPPRLASKDAGAGEARYGGVVNTKLSKSEIAASAFGGLAMTNERAADLRQFGAYIEPFDISPFFNDN